MDSSRTTRPYAKGFLLNFLLNQDNTDTLHRYDEPDYTPQKTISST